MARINLMTQADYAAHRGCSGVAVFKAVKAGRISLIDGKIDATVADIQWSANTRVRASNRKPKADPEQMQTEGRDVASAPVEDYLVSRSRREAAEASIAEMKEAEMKGKYLLKTEVASAAFSMARSMRDGLTNCALRIAAEVAGINNAKDCESVIDREHRALLANMSRACHNDFGPDTATDTALQQEQIH